MIQSRLLDRAEWATKLKDTELELVHPHLPAGAQVVAVEDGDDLVASWALIPALHAECVHIKPEYRGNPRVVRRLIAGMQQTALAMGAQAVFTAAIEDHVADFALRLGAAELEGRHFSLNVTQSLCGKTNKERK
jgi:hypothetical protein